MRDRTRALFRLAMGGLVLLVLAGGAFFINGMTRGERHAPAQVFPGFTAEDMAAPVPQVVVTSLRTGGQPMRAGMRVGDSLVAIDRHPVSSLAQAKKIMASSPRREVDVEFRRDGAHYHVRLGKGEEVRHGS